MMKKSQIVLLWVACLLTLLVPCHLTMSVADNDVEQLMTDLDLSSPSLHKRASTEVDVWSICPPHMSDVDCFYAYLRVYARLRKAAEASDRVSMRNIGKRTSAATSSSASGRRPLHELCPEQMTALECYDLAKSIYETIVENLRDAALN